MNTQSRQRLKDGPPQEILLSSRQSALRKANACPALRAAGSGLLRSQGFPSSWATASCPTMAHRTDTRERFSMRPFASLKSAYHGPGPPLTENESEADQGLARVPAGPSGHQALSCCFSMPRARRCQAHSTGAWLCFFWKAEKLGAPWLDVTGPADGLEPEFFQNLLMAPRQLICKPAPSPSSSPSVGGRP